MDIKILVIHIVLPMLASIGLYCYAFLSTHWIHMNKTIISQRNETNKPSEIVQSNNNNNNNSIQFESQLIRHAFRSHYGLLGYCLDYQWIYLKTIKSEINSEEKTKSDSILFSDECRKSLPESKQCNKIPDCPSYADEDGCNRPFNSTSYYWKTEKCIWQSMSHDYQELPRYLSSSTKSYDANHFNKRIRYYLMLLLFVSAPLITFVALLILICINCVDRFYSIPFAFISFFSLISFTSGIGGLSLFLYEWIHERLYQTESDRFINALNPWINDVEHFGLGFWILLAAIGTNLLTTILSCCFCCGLQSEKSKLRIHVNNGKYTVIHPSPYDE